MVSHFGTADGREQHGVGPAAGCQYLVGERDAVCVDRCATDELFLGVKVADRGEQLPGGSHDLGADAITGQEDDARSHGGGS